MTNTTSQNLIRVRVPTPGSLATGGRPAGAPAARVT
jgi:hypothetical protein